MENSVFFLQSFFFCASGVKRKSGSGELVSVKDFATFLKKGSAKNFPEGKVLAHTHSSPKAIGHIVHHTNNDSVKFWSSFFKSLQGLGRRPMENSVFFLPSFFFCAYGVKRKSGSVELVCVRIFRYFFEKK